MKHRLTIAVALALVAIGVTVADENLSSGPKVGDQIPGPFHCMQVKNADNPSWDGTSQCLVCQNGGRSVAMIFAREVNEPLTGLLKKLDSEVAKSDKKMGAFIVLLTKDEAAEKKLKEIATKEKITHVSLATMENPSGPPEYKVAKDADVTVVLYKAQKVEANRAYKKGEFDDKAVAEVLSDLPKIAGK